MPTGRRLTALAGHAAALGAGAWLLARAPEPGPAAGPDGPAIAVVVPARNEERALPRLLASLAAQSQPAEELVVVDDHSTDATAAVAAAAGARVVTATDLPAGWLGKPWACHTGAAATAAPVLCFLDADVELAPDALARLRGAHARHGGLVSVQPQHRTGRAHEQLSLVANLVEVMGTGGFTGPPAAAMTMAFGPCLLAGRADYVRVGGHAHPAVRRQVCEDAALARLFVDAGIPVRGFAGGATVGFRMYPDGARQLVEGWSKMLAGGARRAPVVPASLSALWVTGALLGAGRGVRALRSRRLEDVAVYLAWAAQMRVLGRRVGRWHPATAAVFPAPLAAFVVLSARAGWLAATGRPARWRDRSVPAT